MEDFTKYPIYWSRVAFGCLNPVIENLVDIISFPTYLIFSNHFWFPAGVSWCSPKLPVDKNLALSWEKICHSKVDLSMGASVIRPPTLIQHFMHAYPKLSFKAKKCIRRSGIFSMVVGRNTSLWWGWHVRQKLPCWQTQWVGKKWSRKEQQGNCFVLLLDHS